MPFRLLCTTSSCRRGKRYSKPKVYKKTPALREGKVYKTNDVFLKESEARLALRKEVKEASNVKKPSAIGDVKSA